MPIDLDTLLFGEPTWEQVVDFYKGCGGFDSEEYAVLAVKKHLRTPEQQATLATLGLSIEDILNGRYTSEAAGSVRQIYAEWNTKLGFKYF